MMAAGLSANPIATGNRVAMSDVLTRASSGLDGDDGSACQSPAITTRTGGAIQLPSRMAGPGR